MLRRFSVIVLAASILIPAGTALQAAPASKPATEPAIPADWVEQSSGGKFFMHTPKDVQEEKVQGIDSLVGQWKGAGLSILSDYGWYSDPMANLNSKNYKKTDLVVGGKPAYIVTYELPGAKPGPFCIGIHFPNATGDGKVRLTVFIQCKDEAAVDLARKILGTVRLK